MNKDKSTRRSRDYLIESACRMGKEPTNAEASLWMRLRQRQMGGLKFRRQHIISHFIVDFYCPKAKLVIELDGAVHDGQSDYDQEREEVLKALGYGVLRFTNAELKEDPQLVWKSILDACKRRIDIREK